MERLGNQLQRLSCGLGVAVSGYPKVFPFKWSPWSYIQSYDFTSGLTSTHSEAVELVRISLINKKSSISAPDQMQLFSLASFSAF